MCTYVCMYASMCVGWNKLNKLRLVLQVKANKQDEEEEQRLTIISRALQYRLPKRRPVARERMDFHCKDFRIENF